MLCIFCARDREKAYGSFNKNNHAIFSGEEKYNEEAFQGVLF